MKQETASLISKYTKANRLSFEEATDGLSLNHNLTDEEKLELVKLEYGNHITGDIDELFIRIMRNVIKMAITYAKEEYDKLSDL